MQFAPGTSFGPYQIVALLGAGGMGEVYRARDTRLEREVAIKVLPQHLSSNPEVRARFEREAKTVSSLNHPNICTLHDVGREGDTDYLVMELVEGETLAARLARGPLPIASALRIAAEIATALDSAHRLGIVHRDLKPGNIMLTKGGAKLMDFGLARAVEPSALGGGSAISVAALTREPTVSEPLTAEGTILGTFQYMSPEQLEGREADTRSDLWALGCVLYEMTTGRPAFEGKSQASLIGAIMHAQPPPVSQVTPVAPPALDHLVRACLAKEPADRVQSAHDVKLQLTWIMDGVTSVPEAAAPKGSPLRGRLLWRVLGITALAASAATVLVMTFWPRSHDGGSISAIPQRYVIGTADLQPSSAPVLSPDGTYIVFSVREGSSRQVYRRDLSSIEVTPVAGTEDGTAPFFSPDGRWIGFATADALKKVPAGGGAAQLIIAEPDIDSADWGSDGTIYFALRAGGTDGATGLARVPDTGGSMEVVAQLDTLAGEREAWLPEILPDGRTVLFSIIGTSVYRIVALHPDGSRTSVAEQAFLGRYTGSGYLVYVDLGSDAVLAAPFDPGRARITGAAVPLTEEIDISHCFDVGGNGKLVYVPLSGAGEGNQIVWLDRNGTSKPALETRAAWTQPRVSPDGKRVLLRKIATNCELWMMDVQRGTLARVVHGHDNHDPVWSPDGRRIAFWRVDVPDMVTLTVVGAREMRELARGQETGTPRSWSAGGGLLVYTKSSRSTQTDIWVRAMDGSSPAVAWLATKYDETQPSITSDGRWIAYVSNETGTPEVYLSPYSDTAQVWQISAGGGKTPLWSRDGRELFFVSGSRMMAVRIDTRPEFHAGAPVELFEGGFSNSSRRDFDVTPDGGFVAVGHQGQAGEKKEIRMLLDWPAVMRQMVGAAPGTHH